MLHTNIYVIGAQCTGKTTLVKALEQKLRETHYELNETQHSPTVIREVARGVLQTGEFTREDIVSSPVRNEELQMSILKAQYAAEMAQTGSWYVSDRSGLDPIVYASEFAGSGAANRLLASAEWTELCKRMRTSIVILCEPVAEWLQDDGIRLMSEGPEEWSRIHVAFKEMLEGLNISYFAVPVGLHGISQRVDFVFEVVSQILNGEGAGDCESAGGGEK